MSNILFICSANKDRSRTAEDHFSQIRPDNKYDSAGTNEKICFQLGTQYIEMEQLEWADSIYLMESKHKKAVETTFGSAYNTKMKVLNIQDHYGYGDKELIRLFSEKLRGLI